MNWLDIVILIVLGLFSFIGLKRGLIKSLFPLVGIILAILIAGRLHSPLAERLSFIDNESAANIVAFAIIVIAVFVVVFILGSILRGILRITFMGWVDRLGGAVFGFVTGWFICSVVIVLMARYVALPAELPETSGGIEDWWDLHEIRQSVHTTINESFLADLQIDSFPVILGLLPGEFDAVRDFFEE